MRRTIVIGTMSLLIVLAHAALATRSQLNLNAKALHDCDISGRQSNLS